MSTYNSELSNFSPGDNYLIKRTIKGFQSDTDTLASAVLLIKKTKTDLDGAAILTKTITSALSSAGQITQVGTGTGLSRYATLQFTLSGADTQALALDHAYAFVLRITLTSGARYTPESGTMTPVGG